MNSDSFFENEFFNVHKGIITVICTVTLAFISIFYLFKGLPTTENQNRSETTNNLNNLNTQNIGLTKSQKTKRKLTINAQDILYHDINCIDLSYIYPILDKLAKDYDLYLIILVSDNLKTDEINKLLECFSILYEDKLILKHVKLKLNIFREFCSVLSLKALVRLLEVLTHLLT